MQVASHSTADNCYSSYNIIVLVAPGHTCNMWCLVLLVLEHLLLSLSAHSLGECPNTLTTLLRVKMHLIKLGQNECLVLKMKPYKLKSAQLQSIFADKIITKQLIVKKYTNATTKLFMNVCSFDCLFISVCILHL